MSGELRLDGNLVTFEEMNEETGEVAEKSADITTPMATDGYEGYYSLEF